MNIAIVKGRTDEGHDYEYFCHECHQLRLSVGMKPTECQNCHSANLTVGEVGELDKAALAAS